MVRNGRAAYKRNDTFWEDIIQAHGFTIHNSEKATRSGVNAECHSIVDLTLTKGTSTFGGASPMRAIALGIIRS